MFPVKSKFSGHGPIHRDEIINIGILPLHNMSNAPVKIRSVTWVDKPVSAHIEYTYAFNVNQTKGYVVGLEGNLPVACPKQYRPRPINSFAIPPHADPGWYIVIAFTISKLGHYSMNQVKITYLTNGREEWQYKDVDEKFRVVNPPLPGPVPIPRSGICG